MAVISRWSPDSKAPLWEDPKGRNNHFFRDINLEHIKQIGPSCVATTLTMIARSTGAKVSVDYFKKITNSQSPHTWSEALKEFGMQLAYCNTDVRRIDNYIEELVSYDDLFLVSFYSVDPPSDPDKNGKLCTAHIVTLCGEKIFDTAKPKFSGGVIEATSYSRLERQTKRIFRVVPLGHPRCV